MDLPPRPYFILIPGSSPSGSWKRWPLSHYATIAQRLQDRGILPLVLCADPELLAQFSSFFAPEHIVAHPSYETWLYLGRHACGALGNDTGPTHFLALAAAIPVLFLFDHRGTPAMVCPPHALHLQSEGPIAHLSPSRVWDFLQANFFSL